MTGDIERLLQRTWAHVLVGVETWSPSVALGTPPTAALEADFSAHAANARQLMQWAADRPVHLTTTSRRVAGGTQVLPTHVRVTDVDAAAALVGGPWPGRLTRSRARVVRLLSEFPHLVEDPAGLVRLVKTIADWDDLDVELLVAAGQWFTDHDAAGCTPRQVPIAGMHAKWLNTRQHLVRQLAAVDDLNLAPPHPSRVHFTYLDPDHLALGGRRHDVATLGDGNHLAYTPSVVIISENKDTAVGFLPIPAAIAIEGDGSGASAIAALDWVRTAPQLFYWGDMDADSLLILEEFRAAGLRATSLLMDVDAFATWQQWGTDTDKNGQPLTACAPRPTPHLTVAERALYELVCSPDWGEHRRVEQERIPLTVACEVVMASVGAVVVLAGGH